MNSKDLYDAIGALNDDILEQSEFSKRKTGCLKRGLWRRASAWQQGHFFLASGNQVEVKEIGSLEEVVTSYGGNLLAERLTASDVRTTSIHLSYTKGGDSSDPADWDTLTIAGNYNGQDFTMDCIFDGQTGKKNTTKAYATTQYGDVEVNIYREKSDWDDRKSFSYRAEFTLDGVTYKLSSIYSDDMEDIYACLDLVLGEPESGGEQSGATLTDVLGLGVYRIEMDEISRHQYKWHYYVKVDGEDVCIAEQFAYDGPEAWSRDLDGDGIPELICNNTYGDGVETVAVYRNSNGMIEEGCVREFYYKEKFGLPRHVESGTFGALIERYDPEQGVFTVTDCYDEPITVEFDDGLEPFDFFPFTHLP